jgi:hypothetical protein
MAKLELINNDYKYSRLLNQLCEYLNGGSYTEITSNMLCEYFGHHWDKQFYLKRELDIVTQVTKIYAIYKGTIIGTLIRNVIANRYYVADCYK